MTSTRLSLCLFLAAVPHLQRISAPAPCTVQGFPIEELDDEYNFRRGFALNFTPDVEDKTHLLPYLRAAHDPSLATRYRPYTHQSQALHSPSVNLTPATAWLCPALLLDLGRQGLGAVCGGSTPTFMMGSNVSCWGWRRGRLPLLCHQTRSTVLLTDTL